MPKSVQDKQQSVLEKLRKHGNVSRAARETGISRRTINRWRLQDKVFAAATTAALSEGRE